MGEHTMTQTPAKPTSTAPVSRVDVTAAAAVLLRDLSAVHGPLMFHQSGGCCDGSSPMCYPDGEFIIGAADEHLGELEVGLDRPIGVWMTKAQFVYWSHTHLTIDVVPGRGAGFSVEAPTGNRFIIRSRLLTDDELDALDGLADAPTVDPSEPG